MTADGSRAGACDLCGRPTADAAVVDDGVAFCCVGCRDVHRTLEEPDGSVPRANEPGTNAGEEPGPEGIERTFLRVDGMHCATCETYLESLAAAREGVVDAEASYVTETVRVDYDPERLSKPELRDALSRTGYTAYLREEVSGADEDEGPTIRAREMTGLRSRRAWDMLEGRYVAGVVFGTFVLLQYVAVLYPTHLWFFYDEAILEVLHSALTSRAAFMFFLVIFTLTGFVLWFTGMPLLRGAYVSLKLRRPNTDLLVAVTAVAAYGYSLLAIALRRTDLYFDLTIAIVVVVMTAVYYEAAVKRRAMDQLTELTISQVEEARVVDADGSTAVVPVEAVEPGDRVLVRTGERVPIDGRLLEGTCTVDEAVVTGETLPIGKRAGEELIGGSVVTNGPAVLAVGPAATSSIDRLTTLVWSLQSADHGVRRRADRVAARLVPAVVGLALLVGLGALAVGAGGVGALLAALTTLLVASPWVVGLATPLSVATSIQEASERGIVVFDETVFERLRGIDVVVFDKTGTLTTGRMDVLEADAPDELLEAAGRLERRASHPAAAAIATAFSPDGAMDRATRTDGGMSEGTDDGRRIVDVESHATGIEGTVDGRSVLVGHPDLFAARGWAVDDSIAVQVADARGFGRLPVVVGRDGEAEGVIVVGDEPRAGWEETLDGLRERGIDVVVLTGDDEAATTFFDRHPAVEHVFAGVPPEGKTETIRRLRAEGCVAMVGDGTNDAPALATADLGISLGSGTALASDAADVAIVADDLESVATAFDLSSAARRRLRWNVGLALSYNAIVLPIAVVGLLNPVIAAAATISSVVLVVGNASRDLVDG
ncbi:heavy metal translocating P-type ATPase [Natronobeatus ordinarius]|uniref:heavy metal translocating P-type ATPase n=1 Tax=Natronobeatus ordinarius TaxID=2963433 RepID=UPI0020CEB6D0|nr:cation-translocating P-type ATPase [Natronobeatus ordinarius]